MSARSSEFDIAETRETATLSSDALASIRTNREAQEKGVTAPGGAHRSPTLYTGASCGTWISPRNQYVAHGACSLESW
eukprot:565190-Prorocentrum_minimum.AAC.1